MDEASLLRLLEEVGQGHLTPQEALERLRHLPYEGLGSAHIDHHRALVKGFPEVVLAQGKTPQQVAEVVRSIVRAWGRALVTRATEPHFRAVHSVVPKARFHSQARIITVGWEEVQKRPGVTVVCAGTSDIPVAEEARITAEMMGSQTETIYDVGVAGLHRLLGYLDTLKRSHVVVVAAGMEGSLAGVVAGLVAAPVIAVPTSAGYGTSFGGFAALLTMLNACAPGLAVVNVDNGFGAGYLAGLINKMIWDAWER